MTLTMDDYTQLMEAIMVQPFQPIWQPEELEMEFGNMCFGHSRGEYPVDKDYQEIFESLLELLGNSSREEYSNDTFEMRPYWWGECECGFDEAEYDWCLSNRHVDCYQNEYVILRERYGGTFNVPEYEIERLCEKHGIEYDGGLGSAMHCTCDYDDKYGEWSLHNRHADDCPVVLPNFHHKPTGYSLTWYKHPLRDAYANIHLSKKEFKEIVKDCMRSLVSNDR